MFTATNRALDDKRLQWLHDEAYSGGVDMVHNWLDRKYLVSGKFVVSHVKGTPEAIANTQTSSERYFQRPDNNYAEVDPNRRSLTGTGGTFILGKRSGKIVADLGYQWSSPELELNDIGFMAQTDNMRQWLWVQYRILNPTKYFRSQRYNINQSLGWDFGRAMISKSYNVNWHLEFKNFWMLSTGISFQERDVSNADLRGGPALHYPGYMSYWMEIGTDRRKKLFLQLNPEWTQGLNGYTNNGSIGGDLVYKPVNALNIALSPSVGFNNNQLQYVATASSSGENRYIVAEIDQTTVRLSIRMTYMVTPNLSVQYYGQPFGTSGHYSDFKYITDANASSYEDRFAHMPVESIAFQNGQYNVDEDQDGAVDYNFGKPDFDFGQFRSNMVIRWEYIPGSTFFLVWTQERNGAFYGDDPAHSPYSFDFTDKAHNIFLMKFTYRFVL
jgi:hypothetical protein